MVAFIGMQSVAPWAELLTYLLQRFCADVCFSCSRKASNILGSSQLATQLSILISFCMHEVVISPVKHLMCFMFK